jgi:hypothetical protein
LYSKFKENSFSTDNSITPLLSDLVTPPNQEYSLVRVNESGEDELASKKRKKETQHWKRVVLKDRLNKGLEYISSKGQKIAAKTMKEPCGSSCRFKCSEKFTKEVRQNIFNSFYELGDKTRQWDFIARHVVTVDKKTTTVGSSRRTCSKNYFLTIQEPLQSPRLVQVCQKLFFNTLVITAQWVRTAEAKLGRSPAIISPDKRGKFQIPLFLFSISL